MQVEVLQTIICRLNVLRDVGHASRIALPLACVLPLIISVLPTSILIALRLMLLGP